MAITITLEGEDEARVSALVNSGAYASAHEAVVGSVLVAAKKADAWARLDAHLDEGLADGAAGRVHSPDEVLAYVRDRLAERSAKAA